MNKKNSSGSGMFMLEMIMAVFFFLLCSGICVMAFVKADRMSHLAQDTNQAVMIAESMAETWKVGGKELLEEKTGAISSKSEETEKDEDSQSSVCTVYLDQKGSRLQLNQMYFLWEFCLRRKRTVWRRQRLRLFDRGIRSSCLL